MATAGLPSKLVAEFLGTFFLVLTVGCNVLSSNAVWGGVSIASSLMVCIYAMGGISGANFNPAVSLALGCTKRMGGPGIDGKTGFFYMSMQLMGGAAAAATYSLLFDETFNLAFPDGVHWKSVAAVEFLYTFMLCFVVLNVAAAEKTENSPNEFYGLAIGSVILAGAYGAGSVSGGVFNPAVAFGIDISSYEKGFGVCLLYGFWQLLGGFFAAIMFRVVRPQEFEDAGDKTSAADWISEFVGTYFISLTVGLNVLAKSKAGAVSIGASIMAMVYALGNVSGAHFNPAVTSAVFFTGRDTTLSVGRVISYWASQLAGGVAAGLSCWMILDKYFQVEPGKDYGIGQAAFVEIIATFLLCYVILCVAVSDATKATTMFGFAAGSTGVVMGNAIGHISGAFLNPAVALGAALVSFINGGKFTTALIYVGAELIGAALAASTFLVTHSVDKPKEN